MPRILVVDDHESTRLTYQLALQREGYEVAVADSCVTAVHALSALDPLHAAFLDLSLPDGTGYDILRWMHARNRFVPTATMTAFRFDFDPDEAIDLGAQAYVDQPLSVETLIALAHSLTSPPSLRDDPNELHSRVLAGDTVALECLSAILLRELPRRLRAAFPRTSFDLAEDAVTHACAVYATGLFRRYEEHEGMSVIDFVYGVAWRKLASWVRAESSRSNRERQWMIERRQCTPVDRDRSEAPFDLWAAIAAVCMDSHELRAAEVLLNDGKSHEIAAALGRGSLDASAQRRAAKQFRDRLIKRLSRHVRAQNCHG